MFEGIDKKAAARWMAIRIAALPVIFVAASFASFFLIYGPGADTIADLPSIDRTEEREQALRAELNLNGPWIQRYGEWLADAAHGDFGEVWLTQTSVRSALADRWNESAELLSLALLVGTLVGGGLAAVRVRLRRTAWRHAAEVLACACDALPVFLVGTLVLIVPAEQWEYSPPLEGTISFFDAPWDHVRQFVPPSLVMALTIVGIVSRLSAGAMRAGVRPIQAVLRSLPPSIGVLFGALIVVEFSFNIRGLGAMFVPSIFSVESAVLQLLLTLSLVLTVAPSLFLWGNPHTPSVHATSPVLTLKNPATIVAIVLVFGFLVLGAVGPHMAPHGADDIGVGRASENPSIDHLFGTDRNGRDTLSRVIESARPTLGIGLSVLGIGFLPGVVTGVVLARIGRRVSNGASIASNWVLSTPLLLVVVAGIGVRHLSVEWMVGIASMFSLCVGVRVTSPLFAGESESVRDQMASGAVSIVAGGLRALAAVVLLHTTLGWLHFDPFPLPSPNWGNDVSAAAFSFPLHYPQLLFPGAALGLVLFGLALLADSLPAASYGSVESRDGSAGTDSS